MGGAGRGVVIFIQAKGVPERVIILWKEVPVQGGRDESVLSASTVVMSGRQACVEAGGHRLVIGDTTITACFTLHKKEVLGVRVD
jgi:hypothetical protein